MKVNGYNITDFVVTTYADMFHRKAVIAYTSDGECYGDVTINIPQYSLDERESFLSADCPDLIDAMVENGYLEITDEVKVNYGTYKVGKFTQKFIDEFERESKWIFHKEGKGKRYEDKGNKGFRKRVDEAVKGKLLYRIRGVCKNSTRQSLYYSR